LNKVNSIARTDVNPHFPNSTAYDLHVAEVPDLGGIESSEDSRASFPVFEAVKPRIEDVGGA